MDALLWLSAGGARDEPALSALREAGWRVHVRRLELGRYGLAPERPDVVLVDVPVERPVRVTLEAFFGAPEMANSRFIALIAPEQAPDAIALGRLSDFVLRPLNVDELLARARRLVLTEGRDAQDCIVNGDLKLGFTQQIDR